MLFLVNKLLYGALLAGAALLLACQDATSEQHVISTPAQQKTHAPVRLLADVQLETVLQATRLPYANQVPAYPVDIRYLTEDKAIEAFLDGDARTLVLSRPLTEQELRVHRQRYNSPPQERLLATGAVLLVAHPGVADTSVQMLQLLGILQGKGQTWTNGQRIIPVCDGGDGSNLRTLFLRLGVSPARIPGLYATGSDSATLAYVVRTPHALGIVGYEALADAQDPAVRQALQQVSLLAVADKPGSPAVRLSAEDAIQHLAKGRYPLAREWRILTREGSSAAGTAFATYLTGPFGQRLLYKCGLMPADPPGREVELVEQTIPVLK
ncbi:MAG: substrate-binding domain-containing protein [Bacteroidetes bacterium]|nr:substrate-binding domain-containing protein [Bacteroidota bacterium]